MSENLFVISGSSGVGKSVVCRKLLEADPTIFLSVSDTTRQKKRGEGSQYHYISDIEFEKRYENGYYLEANRSLFGKKYGTPVKPLFQAFEKGRTCILEIDIVGAEKIKSLFPKAVLIFLAAPSKEVLRRRILERNRDSVDEMIKREKIWDTEMQAAEKIYDHIIVNDDLIKTVQEILFIMKSRKSIENAAKKTVTE